MNARSIGIGTRHPGHDFGYIPFTDDQLEAMTELARGILARHPISPHRVLGHSDVAPARKKDPGELFPWWRLAEAGIARGLRARCRAPAISQPILPRFGYGVPPAVDVPLEHVITAFQRHFRPACVDGMADGRMRGAARRACSRPRLAA